MSESRNLLEIRNLKKYFPIRGGLLNRKVADFRAVDDVSFDVPEGKTLGLVGESGSGKTTIGKCILRLLEPTDGQIIYDGQDITHINQKQMRRLRSDMQMIYQATRRITQWTDDRRSDHRRTPLDS